MPVSSAKKTHLLYMEIICLKDVTDSGFRVFLQAVQFYIIGVQKDAGPGLNLL